MHTFQDAWEKLKSSVTNGQNVDASTLCVYLVLGGILALYCRFLYRRCGASASDSDSITRVFPLLTLVTTAVIAVVKSSLALSLGLVGALSIVRFRAAIKEPEELVYLFLCIAIGLSLGAEQPLLALVLVLVASLFILGMHVAGRSRREHNLMLTITGDSQRYFGDSDVNVLSTLEAIAGRFALQRLDLENGRGQIRVMLGRRNSKQTTELLKRLRAALPDCELSYVNINSVL